MISRFDPRVLGSDNSFRYREECDVGGGAWVLVKCSIPVEESIAPQVYGIYWATPEPCTGGRQKVKIRTPAEVCLWNYEYTVITNERLQEYIECGYFLKDYEVNNSEQLSVKLIEKGRSLCTEEREIIDALMLDGLSEQQACEEYYYTHHTDNSNTGRCYLPTPQLRAQIEAVFGKHGIVG